MKSKLVFKWVVTGILIGNFVSTPCLFHANQLLLAEILQRKKAEKELIEQTSLARLSAEIEAALVTHDNLKTQLKHCSEGIVKHLDAAFA